MTPIQRPSSISTSPAAATTKDDATARALRSIATFEALKGTLAIAAGIGLFSLLHRDLHHIVATLIGHVGLDPGQRYPALLLRGADALQDENARRVVLVCFGYAAMRLVEAYALWRNTAWGQWLGVVTGLVYVPFEVQHALHRPTPLSVGVVVLNMAIVLFLLWQLRRRMVAASLASHG